MKGRWRVWVTGAGVSLTMALGATGAFGADAQVLLDGNLKAGYQGGSVLRAVTGDIVSVELYATGILGAKGVSARIAYDTSELAFDSYVVTDLIARGTGLVIEESGGFLEVGMGSVLGAASASEGRVATLKFRVLNAPNGAEIATVTGLANLGGQNVVLPGASAVRLYSDIPGGIALDADPEAGFQGSTFTGGLAAGKSFEVEIYGSGIAGAAGYSARLTYDRSALRYDGFENGTAIPGFTGLAIPGSGRVDVGGASVTGSASVNEARLALVRFTVLSGFRGSTDVTLTASSLASPAGETMLTPESVITAAGSFIDKPGDSDGNGVVDFNDFVSFATSFGSLAGDQNYNAIFDFDGNDAIDFSDFVTFATHFGS